MPPWGRPPLGRRERERWERERLMYDDAMRFQELDSEEDGAALGNHGVPASVFKQNNRSISDELFFNDGASRYPRQSNSDEHLAYGDRYESPEEESGDDEDGRRPSNSLVRRDSDQLIAQRAMDRIDRAKAKGKNSVNLTHEEIEALNKRYARPSSNSPERRRRDSGDKAKKSQSGSPSGAWTRKRNSRRSSIIASSSTALAPAKPRTKESRKKQAQPQEDTFQHGQPQMPPGLMTMGPGGVPVYTPMGYYNAPLPSGRRTASDGTRYSPPRSGDSSRSTSASSRRGQPAYDAPPYPTRGNSGGRPPSQYIEHPEYWQPPYGHPGYPPYQAYNQHDARRVASGPPNVAYSNVYRRVPAPAAARGRVTPSSSDPTLHHAERGPSGLGNEYEPSSATSEDDDESEEDELARDPTYVEERVERRRPVTAAASATPVSRTRRRR